MLTRAFLIFAAAAILLLSCEPENKQPEAAGSEEVTETAATDEGRIEIKLKELWKSGGFKTPESVLYYPEGDILFVSNIDGKPLEKDSKGFISKLNLDGAIENLEWVTGLNAPKGMGIIGGNLFVTDINWLVEIDIEAGEIIKYYPVDGAVFLNDITVGDSIVYFTDSETSKIHMLNGGNIELFDEVETPNGIYFINDKLYFGGYSSGNIFEYALPGTDEKKIAAHDSGIDGLIPDGNGNFIVSDWKGKTSLIDKNGEVHTILNTTDQEINSADIEFIKGKDMLLIPTFFNNQVIAYELKY